MSKVDDPKGSKWTVSLNEFGRVHGQYDMILLPFLILKNVMSKWTVRKYENGRSDLIAENERKSDTVHNDKIGRS